MEVGHGGLEGVHEEAEEDGVARRADGLVEHRLDERIALVQGGLDQPALARLLVQFLVIACGCRCDGFPGGCDVVGWEGDLEEFLPVCGS